MGFSTGLSCRALGLRESIRIPFRTSQGFCSAFWAVQGFGHYKEGVVSYGAFDRVAQEFSSLCFI